MPYRLEKAGSGYYVVGPSGRHSGKPMPRSRAVRQMRALYAAEKDAGTMPGAMLSGPGGLLATPGMGGRKWGNRRKDSGCTCGVNVATKEQLAPGVTRIRGNLCNVHGRYGPCDASQSGKRKPKAPKGRKPKKPVLTPEQRAQERQKQREANRAKVLTALGIDADGQAALTALRNGEQPNAAALAKMGAIDAGLVEQAADGSYRLTASGRAMLAAADQGDQGRAGDTISGARDRLGARRTRQEEAAQRKRDAEAKRAAAEAKKKQPKGGSSGGKGSARGSAGESADRASERAQRQREHEEDRARRLREHEEDRSRRQRERDEDRAARLAERRQRSQPALSSTTVERVPTHTTRVDMPNKRQTPRKRQTFKSYDAITYKRSRGAAEQRAMFAKMGKAGSGGGAGGLWAKGAGGKRVPPGDNDAVPVKPRSVEATAALLSKTNPIKRLTTEQETSLHYYQSAGHEAVNNTLRGNAANDRQRRDTERTIAALDPMMRKAVLKDNIEAHRGMMIMDQAGHAALARMQPGATLRERGYLSTSINPDVPKRFGAGGASYPGDVSVSMQVRVRAGTRAVYVPAVRKRSGANSEQELLVDRGAVYRVISRRDHGSSVDIVIEVLGHDD